MSRPGRGRNSKYEEGETFNFTFAIFVVFFMTVMSFLIFGIMVDSVIANPSFWRFTMPTIVSFFTVFIMLVKWAGASGWEDEYPRIPISEKKHLDYVDPVMFEYYGMEEKLLEDSIDDRIKRSGNRGEQEVAYTLTWLPDEYKVFNRIYLTSAGRSQQFDHLVVGPKGIFHMETKNHAGEITISSEGNWTIRKKISGKYLTEGMENPLEQLRRHEMVLQEWIKNNFPHIQIPSMGLIILSNPKAILVGEQNSPVPVLKKEKLLDYIQQWDGATVLSPEQVQEIANKLAND